ncbi:TlpA family protein disulfide reductase [Aliikangiella sp. IMCC44653]
MKTIAQIRNKLLFGCFLAILATLSACQENNQFTLLDGDGAKVSLSQYKGNLIIINFWAEWCAPCLEEIPALNQVHQENNQTIVIGVSYDQLSKDELKSIVTKWDFKYPVMATSPSPILPFSLPKTLPTNYIVNSKGEVLLMLEGKQDHNSLNLALNQLKNKS